jgi:hypothetical protein
LSATVADATATARHVCSRDATDLFAAEVEGVAADGAHFAWMGGRGRLGGVAGRAGGVGVGAGGGLGGRAPAAFFGEDVVEGDVEVGVGDGDVGEVLDEFGGHGVVVVEGGGC